MFPQVAVVRKSVGHRKAIRRAAVSDLMLQFATPRSAAKLAGMSGPNAAQYLVFRDVHRVIDRRILS
ncbi:hypothetical protein DXU07_28640 [Bradyrhizobium elkanii]|nr:hypothetical protein BLN97_08860 [Bradyrhizobium elkanii]